MMENEKLNPTSQGETSDDAAAKLRNVLSEAAASKEDSETSAKDNLADLQSVPVEEVETAEAPAVETGEVAFYSEYPHIPVNTALSNGTKISLPHVTKDELEIKELSALAKCVDTIKMKKG